VHADAVKEAACNVADVLAALDANEAMSGLG